MIEKDNDCNDVICEQLTGMLEGWKNGNIELPSMPGSISYQDIFDYTENLITKLKDT